MLCKPILVFLVSFCGTVQTPGVADPDWTQALKSSPTVVVGEIQEKVYIVNYEKTRAALRPVQEGGKTMLPLFTRPDIGYLFRVKIIEAIKPKNLRKTPQFAPGKVVEIFLRSNCATTDVPCLLKGKKYLLFLRPFDANDSQMKDVQFSDAAIYDGHTLLERKIPFDSRDTVMLAQHWEPAKELTKENVKKLDKVRAAAKKEQ
jgi:hypothetical protein